jgi:hypothetical protein
VVMPLLSQAANGHRAGRHTQSEPARRRQEVLESARPASCGTLRAANPTAIPLPPYKSASTGAPGRWTLLCLSSGDGEVVESGCGLDCSVEASGQRAFDRAPNVAVGLALGAAPDLVSTGLWVASHAGDGDGVQCSVQGAVAAAVESVSGVLTATCFQYLFPAERRRPAMRTLPRCEPGRGGTS